MRTMAHYIKGLLGRSHVSLPQALFSSSLDYPWAKRETARSLTKKSENSYKKWKRKRKPLISGFLKTFGNEEKFYRYYDDAKTADDKKEQIFKSPF